MSLESEVTAAIVDKAIGIDIPIEIINKVKDEIDKIKTAVDRVSSVEVTEHNIDRFELWCRRVRRSLIELRRT